MAKKPVPKDDSPLNTPFTKLAGLSAPPVPAALQAVEASRPPKARGPTRAVVRFERKGHGGKAMTRVEQLGLTARELEAWLKDAKQGLGCGGVIEGDALLLQGDQRERLREWLERRGVARISVS